MSTISSFSSNALALFGSSLAGAATSFAFFAFAAQRLGPVGFGKFSTVQVFVASFAVLTDIGLTNATVREVARNKGLTPYITGNVLTLKLMLGLVTLTIVAGLASMLGYEPDTQRLIVIYALSLVPVSITGACVSVFNGLEKMAYSAIVGLGNALGYVIGIVALALGQSLTVVLVAIVVSTSLAAATGLLFLHFRSAPLRFYVPDLVLWKRYFIDAIPFGLISVIGMVGVSAGPILLSRVTGEIAVGYFTSANKIVNVMLLLIGAYNSAIYPVFSRLEGSSKITLHRAYKISMKIMLLTGLSFAVGLTVIAGKIVETVFPGYEQAVPVLQVLGWYTLFALLSTVTLNVLYSEGRQREALLICALATAASLIIDVLLIPGLGAIGVGFALVVFTAVQHVLSYVAVSHRYPLSIPKMIFQSLIVALAVVLVGILSQSWNVYVTIVLMGVGFAVTILTLRIFDAEEQIILANLPLVSRLAPLRSMVPGKLLR